MSGCTRGPNVGRVCAERSGFGAKRTKKRDSGTLGLLGLKGINVCCVCITRYTCYQSNLGLESVRMLQYRAHVWACGHALEAIPFDAADDASAVNTAMQYAGLTHTIEIRQGSRLVAALPPGGRPTLTAIRTSRSEARRLLSVGER
jgi:hypothetical protein